VLAAVHHAMLKRAPHVPVTKIDDYLWPKQSDVSQHNPLEKELIDRHPESIHPLIKTVAMPRAGIAVIPDFLC